MAVKDNPPKPASKTRRNRDVKALRRAAGINVGISIAVATCLLIAANVISNIHSYRRDFQMFGRFGLSQTAKAILTQIDKPVRLTSLYTSTHEDRKGEKYLPRVRDLLGEIEDAIDNTTVVNVTSDRQKAEVLSRLRNRIQEDAKEHRKVISDFQILVNTQAQQYKQLAQGWAKYPPTGWLAQFGTGKAVEKAMSASEEDLRTAANEIRKQLSGAALPDYAGMGKQIATVLENVQQRLDRISAGLRDLSAMPEKATQARQKLTQAAADVIDSANQAIEHLGKAGSAPPADPSKALDTFVVDAAVIADKAQAAARQLASFSQNEAEYVRYAHSWHLEAGPLPAVYEGIASAATDLASQAKGIRMAIKVEVQKQVIEEFRDSMNQLGGLAVNCGKGIDKLLQELTRLDKATQEVFAKAKRQDYLQAQLAPIGDLLDRAKGLAELTEQEELIQKISQENTVIVEVGDTTGVVMFEEVWPLAAQSQPMQLDPQEERRIFNGDMAICSKMLSLTADPFAEVVLTFYEDIPPPYMQQYRPVVAGPIPSIYLRTLRERLQKANLKVTEWNLAKVTDPPSAEPGRPQVLLILPPPEPSPQMPQMQNAQPENWTDKHVQKIKQAIDAGTSAIFLAGYLPPRFMGSSPAYGLGEYLREQWNLEVKFSLRVVQGQPDPVNPGSYEMPVLRWMWLPLSGFTEHPIGKPLRARRLYWLHACPVVPAGGEAAGVTHQDILVAPVSPPGTWAAADPNTLAQKITEAGGRGVRPDVGQGDLLPPFAVAVHARRQAQGKTTQIVVLGVGISYMDDYLNCSVPRLGGDDVLARPEPPPAGDVDLLINSVYHLIGKDEFIGAGPAVIEPIGLIPAGTMTTIKVCLGLLWPLAVLAGGGVVMMIRRR